MTTTQKAFRLPAETVRQLEELADRYGTMTNVIIMAIRDMYKQENKMQKKMNYAELIEQFLGDQMTEEEIGRHYASNEELARDLQEMWPDADPAGYDSWYDVAGTILGGIEEALDTPEGKRDICAALVEAGINSQHVWREIENSQTGATGWHYRNADTRIANFLGYTADEAVETVQEWAREGALNG